MTKEELSELSDEQLLEKSKEMKKKAITNAVFIGMMIGIVLWSILKNTIGIFILVPLYFAYKLIYNPSNDKLLKEYLKERNIE